MATKYSCQLPWIVERKKNKTPKGHIVVYVGEESRRFVVPISCLKRPQFQQLLAEAAEAYGFGGQGGILLPCNESTFHRAAGLKDDC